MLIVGRFQEPVGKPLVSFADLFLDLFALPIILLLLFFGFMFFLFGGQFFFMLFCFFLLPLLPFLTFLL